MMPAEVRRQRHVWFGDPWPSGICYDDDGRLLEDMRIPVPAGETCPQCEDPIGAADRGQAMPYPDGIRYVHRECLFRQVMGPLAHLQKRCRCYGGTSSATPGLSRREEAIAVWNWVMTHGI
jgi:hypothetical protein